MTSPRLRTLLTRIAPIYKGEWTVFLLCLTVNFLVVAGIMFGRNARDSLFLVYFGAQYLAYMYFANAVFLIVTSLIYTALVDQTDRGKFLGGLSLAFIVSLVASRLILFEHPHWFFPVLYIQAQVIWYFSLLQYWTFVGDLFDTRQAKRLFPLLAVGGLLGMISVGLASRNLVKALGSENLFVLWAVLILTALILGTIVYRRHRGKSDPSPEPISIRNPVRPTEWQKVRDGFREVGREPLLRSMAGYVLLLWTVYAVVDFCFNKTMHERYPDPNDLTTFFGRFVGVQGFLCLMVQLFLTRALISWLGVGTTINFHPAFLVMGTAWMSIRYGIPSVLTTKLGDATMLYTFSDSSYQLLYSPVPPDRRARVRGFIEGYIRPLSLAAAGILVLVGNSYLKSLPFSMGRTISTRQQLSWGAFIVSVIWLGFALTAKRGYIHALLHNLQADSLSMRQAAAIALSKLKDSASVSLLAQSLQSGDSGRTVTALELLENIRTPEAQEAIAGLLTHPDPVVRATAASAIGRMEGRDFSDRVTPLLHDPNPRVRANAVEALSATRSPALLAELRPRLQDSSTRARINAILSIASIEGVRAAVEWMPFLRELARGDRTARSSAIFALGRLPLDESIDVLRGLLKDSDLQIRCEAAQALGQVGAPRVVPELVEALASSAELRHAARRSLAAIARKYGGDTTQELVRSSLSSDRPEIRSELADVLGRLNPSDVLAPLITLLKDSEWRVRWKVLKSFERLARSAPLPENARMALFNYAHEELENLRQSLLCSQTLVPNPRGDAEILLAQALEDDRVKIEERVFRMLGIVGGRDRMIAIFNKLNSGDARLRADALEALDTLAPKSIAREVLQLLESAPELEVAPPQSPSTLVAGLANHPKPWIRTCAVYYLGHRPQENCQALIALGLTDKDFAVRETALYSGWLVFDGAWQSNVEEASHSPDVAVRRVAQLILKSAAGPQTLTARSEPMLLTVEKVLFLKSAPLFAGLESEELAALAEIALEQEYQPGETMFDQGQKAHHLYVIVRGKVDVSYRADSTQHSVAALGEKECLGETAILDDEPRSATARAMEPTLVLKIDRDSFRELIIERPQISFAILKILSARLRQKDLETEALLAGHPSQHYT